MYQALYRQYRPRTFDEVLGQDHITRTIKNQIKNGNISHAYLFAGTKGTGKTSTAKIFSRAVNCPNNVDGNPCNECEICRGIFNETIMDVIEMDAASNRKIEDIRDLKDKVIYPPSKTKYKIYIIDEVHMLTNEAFNALLKTLEEPPEHLIFILATTEMEKLPKTILSRCQRFDFKRISTDEMVLNMKGILKNREVTVDDRALKLIARNSDGAMRDALSLLDQCIAYKDHIDYSDALDILGIANLDILFELVDCIKEKDVEKLLLKIDDIIQEGKDINQFIKDLIMHFRNLLIIKTSNASLEIMDMDEDSFNNYRLQGEKFSVDFILRGLEILSDSESKGKWAAQPRIILEMSLIKLVKLEEDLPLIERVEKLERDIKAGNIRVASPDKSRNKVQPNSSEREKISSDVKDPIKSKPTTFEEKPEVINYNNDQKFSLKDISAKWDDIMNVLKRENIKIYAFLREGKLHSYENSRVTIVYDEQYGFHLQAVNREDNKEVIESIVSRELNKETRLKFLMVNEIIVSEDKTNSKDEIVDFFGENMVKINKEENI